jgi:uncharacterized protein (TIGR02271 family)
MTQQRSPYTGEPVVDWLDQELKLRDANGNEVGRILEINPDFLIVETGGGFLGLGERETLYVPRSQVLAEDDDRSWVLGVPWDSVERTAWSTPPSASTWSATVPEVLGDDRPAGTRLVRYEEELDVTKVARQAGEVRVTKDVVEEPRTVEVPARHEEVRVDRRPVSGEATPGEIGQEAFRDETIRVPVMEEDVEVSKVVRPVEEIEVSTTPVEETRRVEETVRREEFDIEDTTERVREGTPREASR